MDARRIAAGRARYPAWKDGDNEIVMLHKAPLTPLDIAAL